MQPNTIETPSDHKTSVGPEVRDADLTAQLLTLRNMAINLYERSNRLALAQVDAMLEALEAVRGKLYRQNQSSGGEG